MTAATAVGTTRPVVVVGSTFLPQIVAQLQRDLADCSVIAMDLGRRDGPRADLTALEPDLSAAAAIVPIRGSIDRRVLDLAVECRIVQQFGAGVDMVDLEAAGKRRVPVCNVPSRIGGNAESVAEMALFHLIAAGRDYRRLQQLIAAEDFGAPFGKSLYGKTVCIVGFGNIGSQLARLLRPFKCNVVGLRRRPPAGGQAPGPFMVWPMQRLAEALAMADFVVVTIPLNTSTVGIIGAQEIRAMKPGAILVNTSRGPTVDRTALLRALESGRIAAAGLDVFWEEPVSATDPILDQNVNATPHCGGLTDHMLVGTSRIAAENIRRVLDGHRPRYRVRR